MKKLESNSYVAALKQRGARAHVTTEFQLIGLEIALALKDLAHKALYIKYAKEFGSDKMLMLAKDVASRRDIKNLGAYFMKMAQQWRATNKPAQTRKN